MKKLFFVFLICISFVSFGFDGWDKNHNFNATTFNKIKIARILFSQIGTSAPTSEVVLENTLGISTTWTRDDVGQYYLDLTGTGAIGANTLVFYTVVPNGSAVAIKGGIDGNPHCLLHTFNSSGTAVDIDDGGGAPYNCVEIISYQ